MTSSTQFQDEKIRVSHVCWKRLYDTFTQRSTGTKYNLGLYPGDNLGSLEYAGLGMDWTTKITEERILKWYRR